MLARLVGDIGVSTFSVLSFIYSLANAILSGVAQGIQPLWGHCYGKQDTDEMNWYFRCGIIINCILAVLIYGVLFFFDKPVIRIFNRDADLVRTASAALPLFSLSFIPMALNLIYTAFFSPPKEQGQQMPLQLAGGLL
ncbi:MATE family efflux transporter [uncultured Acetatifactor sp.]|uniref:MATE family efflux transporter n=1 Tax=uncultured Acetatifactor sp. TaxID=1671927 RepID=UPI00262613F7|nr:MATE family efflux transporter [uncultured Acetatifactor sp.]